MDLSPKQLDEQSQVRIHRWVDVYSEECRALDDDYKFTLHIIKVGFQDPPFLFTDRNGRIWGRGTGTIYFPLHMEAGLQLVGFRIVKKAAN